MSRKPCSWLVLFETVEISSTQVLSCSALSWCSLAPICYPFFSVSGNRRIISSLPVEAVIYYAFNICLLSTFSSTVICWMAIWLSFWRRSPCCRPSLIKTAFRFSILLKQINCLLSRSRVYCLYPPDGRHAIL